jgi:ABC-type dipeptide/oligopeptide/nickel transport system permease subunit
MVAGFIVSLKVTVIAVLVSTPVAPPAGLWPVIVGGAPAWVTVWVRPAIVSVPVLAFAPVLAATLKDAKPLSPAPLEDVVTQPTLLEADQEQPLCVHTSALPEPPEELKDWLLGVTR